MSTKITIGYLYAKEMNTYGDTGNVIALQKRCQWRDIQADIVELNTGDAPKDIDLFFFGGGQDLTQATISKDLFSKKAKAIQEAVNIGIPLLSICGGYQMLGQYYQPFEGEKLEGLGIFPAYTKASRQRMIGNAVVDTQFGKLIGFENHSGKTYLEDTKSALGKVLIGAGNNGEDHTEGCIYKNAIGCYLHGSLLPKNPILADWLIKKALEVKYKKPISLQPLDDSFEESAHNSVINRFVK